MRIPLIAKIKLNHAMVFATAVFVLQMLEHTDIAFAALCWTFIIIACIGFNTAGGFLYPSGWFIFFNAMLTCIVGITFKTLLGQPGQSNLLAANTTMLAYCLGMFAIALVAALTRRLRPRDGLLVDISFGEDMKKAAIGALIVGVLLLTVSYTAQDTGSFLSAIRQINYFTQMSVLLATFYQVKKTHGRESTNWVVWTASAILFAGGLFGFSKQGLLTAGVSWIGAALAGGHHFTRKQFLGIGLAALFFQMYLVPYSQVGRNYRSETSSLRSDIQISLSMLSHLGATRQQYLQDEKEVATDLSGPHLYDRPEGFLDRLNMLAPDDALIAYTENGNQEGLLPTYWSFLNVIPHFFWKSKPFYAIGNSYAREIGVLGEEDETTGISFSPTGDAFHQVRWWGVLLIVPLVVFILFMVADSLSGDIRRSPWGLLFCVFIAHTAPEGMIAGQIYVATYAAFGVTCVALLSKYVLPIVSGVLTNTDRTRVVRTATFSTPQRTNPIGPPSP